MKLSIYNNEILASTSALKSNLLTKSNQSRSLKVNDFNKGIIWSNNVLGMHPSLRTIFDVYKYSNKKLHYY